MTIPLVSSTSATCSSLYQSVKGSSPNVSGAFGLVESMLGQALGAVATTLKDPLVQVDSKLCQGLDTLQEKVPIVKEQPQEVRNRLPTFLFFSQSCLSSLFQIYNRAKTAVNTTLHIDPVWSKTNQLLTSEYGTVVLTGFDTTVDFADKCIDYYLPNDDEETETGC
ncbi:hypothetical protein AAG570_003817 [Ranatra chinensis]|uniref:Uncharacterized protein n=1 Tax=Ranatra chinensis TaxID=642074 RepID=A0ABD0YMS6_9HEMI